MEARRYKGQPDRSWTQADLTILRRVRFVPHHDLHVGVTLFTEDSCSHFRRLASVPTQTKAARSVAGLDQIDHITTPFP
jgi:hypothetical protein